MNWIIQLYYILVTMELILIIDAAVRAHVTQFFHLAFKVGDWLFKIKKVVHSIRPMFISKIVGAYIGCFTCFSALLQAGARR